MHEFADVSGTVNLFIFFAYTLLSNIYKINWLVMECSTHNDIVVVTILLIKNKIVTMKNK